MCYFELRYFLLILMQFLKTFTCNEYSGLSALINCNFQVFSGE